MWTVTVCLVFLVSTLQDIHAGDRYVSLKSSTINHSTAFMTNIGKVYKCKHQICDEIEGYPEWQIDDAMQDEHTLKILLKDDPLLNTEGGFSMKSRIGSDVIFTQLCNVEGPTTHTPRAMRNVLDKWKYIVNTDKYHQTFTVETCRQLANPKRKLMGNKNYCTEFNFRCKQDFQVLSLLIFEDGIVRFDRFDVPTNCRCCAG